MQPEDQKVCDHLIFSKWLQGLLVIPPYFLAQRIKKKHRGQATPVCKGADHEVKGKNKDGSHAVYPGAKIT